MVNNKIISQLCLILIVSLLSLLLQVQEVLGQEQPREVDSTTDPSSSLSDAIPLPLPLGSDTLKNEFLLNYSNFNHGSFGSCPQPVLLYQESLRRQQEQQPDLWFRSKYYQLLNETRNKIAKYVGVLEQEADGLVLVESASTAVNSIMRSFPWTKAKDIIMIFSVAYPMVQNTAEWLAREHNSEIIVVPIAFPISEEQGDTAFLGPMQIALKDLKSKNQLNRLKMVVLDHIVSTPAVKEPVQELAAMIKLYTSSKAFVLVDGAHVMGQVRKLDLSEIGNIDAYLSNGHKWLYSPKGSAFLWMNQTSGYITELFPEPTVISSANFIDVDNPNSITQRYAYVSTRDYTAFLSMGAAIDFRQTYLGGEETIHTYCRNLALEAKHHLMSVWKVEAMAPDSMEEFMINIQLPPVINTKYLGKKLMDYMLQQHNTYMLALYDASSEMFYTRLSSQVYLNLSDFQRMGAQVLQFVESIILSSPSNVGINEATTTTREQ